MNEDQEKFLRDQIRELTEQIKEQNRQLSSFTRDQDRKLVHSRIKALEAERRVHERKLHLEGRFTLHETVSTRTGNGWVTYYTVMGLPCGVDARIAHFPPEGWRCMVTKKGVDGPWIGNYDTAEAALAALEAERF
jgi:hypothetical protein